jgi:hypothetical protein
MQIHVEDHYRDLEPVADSLLLRQLERLYARALPPRLADPEVVLEGAATKTEMAAAPARRSTLRAIPAFAALPFVLLGAAYAATLLAATWERDVVLQRVAAAGLAREFDQSQTIGGVTVKLERAYADPNRIAVGLSVDAPALGGNVIVDARSIMLRDGVGHVLAPLVVHGSRSSTLAAAVAVFDGAAVAPADPLGLELVVSDVRGERGTRTGPWRFSFALPVMPARYATGRADAAPGIALGVLVIAAPSEVRVEVTPQDVLVRLWNPSVVRIEAGGRSYLPSWGRCQEGVCTLAVFSDVPPGDPGSWVVYIDELQLVTKGSGPRETLHGPWRIDVSE